MKLRHLIQLATTYLGTTIKWLLKPAKHQEDR